MENATKTNQKTDEKAEQTPAQSEQNNDKKEQGGHGHGDDGCCGGCGG